MAGEKKTTIIISLAVIALIVTALVGSLAEESLRRTQQTSVSNEAINIASARLENGDINITYPFRVTNYPTGWKTETTDCNINNVVFGNSSNDFTVTTDYTFTASTGVLLLKNSTNVRNQGTNSTLIDYSYCANDYLNSSWGRSVIDLIAGFFAIASLLISVGLFYSVAKEHDII